MRPTTLIFLFLLAFSTGYSQSSTDSTTTEKAPSVLLHVQAGGLTTAGFCPVSLGIVFGSKKIPVFNYNRFYFLEGGLISNRGYYIGSNLSLGQKADFGSFLVYIMAGYGFNSISMKDFKDEGTLLVHGYTADVGVRIPLGKREGFGVTCELGYTRNRPLSLKLGLTF